MKDCSAKWGDYKKEKNVKGRDRAQQVHERLPEGLKTSKNTEDVDETDGLVDALCRLSVLGGLRSILQRLATLSNTA